MPLPDLNDPNVIHFLVDNYEKERILRAKWFSLHKDKLYKAATLTRAPTNYTLNDITRALMVAGMATTTREHVAAARNRMHKPVKDHLLVKLGVEKQAEMPMKPIEKEVKDLLKESKQKYLKSRETKAPEDKYNFIETESWTYGWQLGENALLMPSSFGKVSHVMRSMRNRVGPQPDPENYKSPDDNRTYCN